MFLLKTTFRFEHSYSYRRKLSLIPLSLNSFGSLFLNGESKSSTGISFSLLGWGEAWIYKSLPLAGDLILDSNTTSFGHWILIWDYIYQRIKSVWNRTVEWEKRRVFYYLTFNYFHRAKYLIRHVLFWYWTEFEIH